MHIVGLSAREVPPPQVGAGPIAAAGVVIAVKLLVGHGAMMTERATRAPIVGNAGVGGHPGAGDDQHVSGLQLLDDGRSRHRGRRGRGSFGDDVADGAQRRFVGIKHRINHTNSGTSHPSS